MNWKLILGAYILSQWANVIRGQYKIPKDEPLFFKIVRHNCSGVFFDLVKDEKYKFNATMENAYKEQLTHIAGRAGNVEIMEFMARQKDIDVNAERKHGTPLARAIRGNHTYLVKKMLEMEEVDVNAGKAHPLTFAVRWSTIEILKMLLAKQGVDIDGRESPISSQKRSLQFRKHNALMLAAHMGFKEKVEVIADRKDVDFWKEDNFGWTALMLAYQQGHTDIVNMLKLRMGFIKEVESKIENPELKEEAKSTSTQTETLELKEEVKSTTTKKETPELKEEAKSITTKAETPELKEEAKPITNKAETPGLMEGVKSTLPITGAPELKEVVMSTTTRKDTSELKEEVKSPTTRA